MKWAVRKTDATILREEEQWLEVPALSAVWMDKVELPQIDCFNEYVSYEAWENDQIISQGTVIFFLSEILPLSESRTGCARRRR